MIEKEHKVLLTKEQYDKIDNFFCWDDEFVQINHYYNDKDNCIYSDDITVRIREKNGQFRLQTKRLKKRQKSLFVKEEKEIEITEVMNEIPSKLLETLIEKKYSEIKRIGSLKTFRKVCKQYPGVVICLDCNEYCSKSDYELEIEYNKDIYIGEIITKLETEVGIQFTENVCGKNSRFFREYLLHQTI